MNNCASRQDWVQQNRNQTKKHLSVSTWFSLRIFTKTSYHKSNGYDSKQLKDAKTRNLLSQNLKCMLLMMLGCITWWKPYLEICINILLNEPPNTTRHSKQFFTHALLNERKLLKIDRTMILGLCIIEKYFSLAFTKPLAFTH